MVIVSVYCKYVPKENPKKIYEQVNKLFDPIISDNKSFL